MAVFSFSIIVNAAGINLRNLTLEDLNPRTWILRANRTGHLLLGRAEKFYYDLRVVYEIESRLRQLRPAAGQGAGQQGPEAPRSQPSTGGSSDSQPTDPPQLAQDWAPFEPGVPAVGMIATGGEAGIRKSR
jgi:hypothetical protein